MPDVGCQIPFVRAPMSILTSDLCSLTSEFQPPLARRFRECLDPAVVKVSAAVKDDLFYPFGDRALGEAFSHGLGSLDIGSGLQACAHFLFQRGGGCDRAALAVIDNLRVDMFGRPEH